MDQFKALTNASDEVAREFPDQADNYQRLVASIADYNDLTDEHQRLSAREVVSGYLTEPRLV
ncbi:MAG: hypothetical protein AAFZ07_29930, partial [Actinomycetota bacterium]